MSFDTPPATQDSHINATREDAVIHCECGQPIEYLAGVGAYEDGDQFTCNNCGRTYELGLTRTQDATEERPYCLACDTQLETYGFSDHDNTIRCPDCHYTIPEVHSEAELRRHYLVEMVTTHITKKGGTVPVWQINGDTDALSDVIDMDADVECPPATEWLEAQFEALKDTDLIAKDEIMANHASDNADHDS